MIEMMRTSAIVFLLTIGSLNVVKPNNAAAATITIITSESQVDQTHRTAFHFQPPSNWMNDPNGPTYFNGFYHLFYQHNPTVPVFYPEMYWGHSVSSDLVNWTPLDLAFAPNQVFDIYGCWSGSATILPGNMPAMLYTGLDSKGRQVQNLAVPKNLSDPYLREWVRHKGNPVINLPDGIKSDSFRDPTTGWLARDGIWRTLVASVKNGTGIAFLYRSEDFVTWSRHKSPFYRVAGTGMWECLDFFPVLVNTTKGLDTSDKENYKTNGKVKHVLKVGSVASQTDYYLIGSYNPKKEKYVPRDELTGNTLRLDYGKYYASKSFFDPIKNRRILMAWVNESDSIEDGIAKGWSGLHAFPRTVWLDKNRKQLVQWPIEEIETLHEKEASVHNEYLKDGSMHEISGITASQADVMISFKLTNLREAENLGPAEIDPQHICSKMDASKNGKFGPFGLLVLVSSDLTERTAVFFRVFQYNGRFSVIMCSDQSRSSTRNGIDKTTYGALVDVDPAKDEIALRTLIDGSVVESFGGGGKACITARVYPTLAIAEEARLFVFNNGTESVVISELKAWSVKKARINI